MQRFNVSQVVQGALSYNSAVILELSIFSSYINLGHRPSGHLDSLILYGIISYAVINNFST